MPGEYQVPMALKFSLTSFSPIYSTFALCAILDIPLYAFLLTPVKRRMIREKDFLRKQVSPSQGSEGVLGGERAKLRNPLRERVFPQKSHKYLKTQKGVQMAYIEKERVTEIRNELKKLFPAFKFSVTRRDCSLVSVKIMKGDIDFFDDVMRPDDLDNWGDTKKLSDYAKQEGYTSINEYSIESNWEGKAREMLLQVREIVCKGSYNRNAGDMGADYCDMTFFIRISVGSYDKPYELISTAAIAA
jgi:hypothetical protein